MNNPNGIFSRIKMEVQRLVPQAEVILFGSRAKGDATDESDWDILVLSPHAVTNRLKQEMNDALFPISVEIAAFIQLVIVSKDDWLTNPSYYALRQSIAYKPAV